MEKNNVLSGSLVVVVILMMIVVQYITVIYMTGVLNAAVTWASTDQIAKLQACGVTVPQELFKLKADIPTLLLPAIYVGLPGLMLAFSILMFVAGYYYGYGRESSSSKSVTTTTTSPNRSGSGKFQTGRHTEETRTMKASSDDEAG